MDKNEALRPTGTHPRLASPQAPSPAPTLAQWQAATEVSAASPPVPSSKCHANKIYPFFIFFSPRMIKFVHLHFQIPIGQSLTPYVTDRAVGVTAERVGRHHILRYSQRSQHHTHLTPSLLYSTYRMSIKRYYYSDTIADFLNNDISEIVGQLTLSSTHDINEETAKSWHDEIIILQQVLACHAGHGSVYFEYSIPRMGRRVDVMALIDGIVFVLEFKTAEQLFTREAILQVWDYALDLKNFHEGSKERTIFPILIAPNEMKKHCSLALTQSAADGVYEPQLCNKEMLAQCIQSSLQQRSRTGNLPSDDVWAKSGYEPTPTIIEAAIALYEENTVEDITRHDGNIEESTRSIERIIEECRSKSKKAICFVTGVPGAGKTLIGLQTAIEQFNKGEKAVYLSGNFPLVSVLQEALTRDYIRRSKATYKVGSNREKPCNKSQAESRVKAFIQMIHHYRDLYLEGTEIKEERIVPKEGYFQSHADKAYIPAENVAIFDEAQRAWTKEALADFMKRKKGLPNFPYSEPEYLISCMDRRLDWSLIICLIGGGQEINKGEAGIREWIDALNRSYKGWEIYMSNRLTEQEYAGGKAMALINDKRRLHIEPALHLSVSMRSFRAEKVSLFVHQLLELNQTEAAATLRELKNYPIVLTRSLDTAKQWLRLHARGSERIGLLASSKAERLKAISVNVRYKPDFVHWFLDDDTDIRSSNFLEDTLTEFQVQGLEVDWSCVLWDADLRLNTDGNHATWDHYQLRGGAEWNHINKEETKLCQINAYRVLLTRARQGMIIVVPNGDANIPPDTTRNPEWYNSVYNYLKEIGITEA